MEGKPSMNLSSIIFFIAWHESRVDLRLTCINVHEFIGKVDSQFHHTASRRSLGLLVCWNSQHRSVEVFEVVAKKLRARKRSARNCVMYVMLGDVKAFECEMSLKKWRDQYIPERNMESSLSNSPESSSRLSPEVSNCPSPGLAEWTKNCGKYIISPWSKKVYVSGLFHKFAIEPKDWKIFTFFRSKCWLISFEDPHESQSVVFRTATKSLRTSNHRLKHYQQFVLSRHKKIPAVNVYTARIIGRSCCPWDNLWWNVVSCRFP